MSNYELFAKIGGDSSGLQRAMGNAQKSIGRTSDRFAKLRAAGLLAFKGVSVAATAAAGTLTALTVSGLRTVDSQAKLARSIGASIDGLRGLQIAASDAGIESGALGTAMQMMNARLAEAARGGNASAKAIERMGLDANELVSMDIDERIATMADQMQAMGFTAAQAQDELNQLGIRNRQLALLMIQGGDAIRAARQEVDDYGESISEVDAAQVEVANDAFSRVGRTMRIIKTELAIIVAGPLKLISDRLVEAGREAQGFRSLIEPALVSIATMFAKVGDLIQGMRIAYNLFGSAVLKVGATVIRVQNLITGALTNTISKAMEGITSLIEIANNVPGINIPTDGIDRFRERIDGIVPMFENMANELEKQALDMSIKADEMLGEASLTQMLEGFLERVREWRADFVANFQGAGNNAAEGLKQPMENTLTQLEEFGLQAARNIQDSFANFLMDPFKDGLKGMLRAFVQMLNQMVAQIAAREILMAFFRQFEGGEGPLANIAKAFLQPSGGRATGGPVMANTPYMVGERGPELVVPNKSGYVVPNNKLGGGGGVSLSVNINAEDPGAEGRIRTMIERDMAPQIIQAAMGRTMNSLRRPAFA